MYIYAAASFVCLWLGALVVFSKTHWLGKYAPREQTSRKEQKVIGGVFLFLGVLGSMTSYAVFVKGEPMYFLGVVFEWVRVARGE
ncbi:MAG: hypothetical protein COX57_09785 [Alphaproteobacteria bacterium CG_4_10_14_0_2_um_filter_63_37]|nr:MAG: hypothetical protein AUJ55_08835 [Proteobacteria bacterium CG1_02_64_396]PJA24210.1 MAG: hypothetical protein COX57_09785 [Alphaproteobacteria bacterium CG_4_10_14_0_2_um_filter_63_37]